MSLSVWFYLIWDDFHWEKLPIGCLSLWFHLISFVSKNNDFRAKMPEILKIDLFIGYNFCSTYFFPRSIFIDMKWKKLIKNIFFFLTLKIKFASIFIIIFVISASKYVVLVSFKLIEGKCFSEVYPTLIYKW